MRNYLGWAVKQVESKASAPRFQVGTIREDDTRWEWGHYCDREGAGLALFQKGVDEVGIKQMLDAATASPGKAVRHMLGTGTINVDA
jgi:hypothetical protein